MSGLEVPDEDSDDRTGAGGVSRDLPVERVRGVGRRHGARRNEGDEHREGLSHDQKSNVMFAPTVRGWITLAVARMKPAAGRAEPPEYAYSSKTLVAYTEAPKRPFL